MLTSNDDVNHPAHYAVGWSNGAEVIDVTENLSFNRGNVVKYVCRAGLKEGNSVLQDLRKAKWYLDREIMRVQFEQESQATSVIMATLRRITEDNEKEANSG